MSHPGHSSSGRESTPGAAGEMAIVPNVVIGEGSVAGECARRAPLPYGGPPGACPRTARTTGEQWHTPHLPVHIRAGLPSIPTAPGRMVRGSKVRGSMVWGRMVRGSKARGSRPQGRTSRGRAIRRRTRRRSTHRCRTNRPSTSRSRTNRRPVNHRKGGHRARTPSPPGSRGRSNPRSNPPSSRPSNRPSRVNGPHPVVRTSRAGRTSRKTTAGRGGEPGGSSAGAWPGGSA